MTEPAYGTATGTVISERTSELVLPSFSILESSNPSVAPERMVGLSHPTAPSTPKTSPRTSAPSRGRHALASETQIAQNTQNASESQAFETQRGAALPGDRGPRSQATQTQRPSFWRRIAMGGRRSNEAQVVPATQAPASFEAVEHRIVEPLLQALVSVEAKLERSHVDLSQRSDQVEQRLTQLWDIEEQLGTLVELQESLLHVSEQQRRLASAVESQTRTLRWLVGAIFFSLGGAAFVVAAVLR